MYELILSNIISNFLIVCYLLIISVVFIKKVSTNNDTIISGLDSSSRNNNIKSTNEIDLNYVVIDIND